VLSPLFLAISRSYCILLIILLETGEITWCGVSIKYNKTWIVVETGEITRCGVSIKYNKTWILLETGEITQCGVSIWYNKTWIRSTKNILLLKFTL
jgi:hypothetical protein